MTKHLSRLAAPVTWPIKRKGIKWIAKPLPGPHSLTYSMPLSVLLRDILKLIKTNKEAKKILNKKEVKVNNKVRKESNFSVGLFDVISLPSMKKNYRMLLNKKGKLNLIEIPENEANISLLKIENKKTLKKEKIQASFNNGWNMRFDELGLKNGDVILYDIEKKTITKQLKQEPGSLVYIIAGKRVGRVAKLISIKEEGLLRKKKLAKLIADKSEWEVPLEHTFVIGKAGEKSSIFLGPENPKGFSRDKAEIKIE